MVFNMDFSKTIRELEARLRLLEIDRLALLRTIEILRKGTRRPFRQIWLTGEEKRLAVETIIQAQDSTFTIPDIVTQTNVDRRTVHQIVQYLIEDGCVERIKRGYKQDPNLYRVKEGE